MKIYEDAMDQCLLCAGYDFHDDTPLRRESHCRAFGPSLRQKEYWRYKHSHLGLTTFVAYEGVEPVGHIELIPIEHALRPIKGWDLITIQCIHVPPAAQGRGIGKALLERAMVHASEKMRGLAAIGQAQGAFMPCSFFEHHGFSIVDQRAEEHLLIKRWKGAGPAAFLDARFTSSPKPGEICVEYILCPQCPLSGFALNQVRKAARGLDAPIRLNVHEAAERRDVLDLGHSHALYIDGGLVGSMPPDGDQLVRALRRAADAHKEFLQ